MGRRGGFSGWLFIVAVAFCCASAKAEVKIHTLASECIDFAFNHDTGDLAMVVHDKNEAWLIRAADLQAGKINAPVKLKVGSGPRSIVYKKFKDTAVYAIVCLQDSHMYLMNATDGQLMKKIELGRSGVHRVTSSINPADPFVYYNYAADNDTGGGVVNLRTMQNQPKVFNRTFLSFISASGEVAYRPNSSSSIGIESLLRTTSLTDDKVEFSHLISEHDQKEGYVPDPFDRYTAASESIYNRNLSKRVVDLPFIPLCFFRKLPIVVGFEGDNYRRDWSDRPEEVKLRAGSYNTFSPIGNVVSFQVDHRRRQDSLSSLPLRVKVFANDSAKQVIYAAHQQVVLIPLADFKAPEEPFLFASLKGADRAEIGKELKFSLQLQDPRVKLQVKSLPDGMQAKGDEFTWTPRGDQVGPAQVTVLLQHGELERTQVFDLQVVRRGLELPFAPSNLALSSDQKRMLIWEGAVFEDEYARTERLSAADGAAKEEIKLYRMAVIDLGTGALLAEKKLKEPIERACAVGDYFALLSARSQRCEVVRASDLERQKAIAANTSILLAEPFGQMLVLQTEEGTEVYSLPKLDRVAVMRHLNDGIGDYGMPPQYDPYRDTPGLPRVIDGRLHAKGLFLDENLKTSLILSPGLIPVLPGAKAVRSLDDYEADALHPYLDSGFEGTQDGSVHKSAARIPHSSAIANLELRVKYLQTDSFRNNRVNIDLTLSVTGDQPLLETILQGERSADSTASLRAHPPRLSVSGGYAFVLFESKVYRIALPKVETASKLAITPGQSALFLSGKGTTTLTHEATGGKGPYQFAVLSSLDGVSIDEKTGTVTLTEEPLMEAAKKSAEDDVVRHSDQQTDYVDSYRSRAPSLIARGTDILGRKPTGYPVAIPIRVEVTDAEQASAALQYFVIAEVPSGPFSERLKKVYDEHQAKIMAAMSPKPAAAPGQAGGGGDADLRKKVEALEQRIDNLTRQLNEVLRRLDERK